MRAICRMEESRLDGESLVLAFGSIDVRVTIQRKEWRVARIHVLAVPWPCRFGVGDGITIELL